MADSQSVARTIHTLTRLRNSPMGNPRYRVSFADNSSAVTRTNAGWVYEITDSWIGADVLVTFSGHGTIADMTRAQ